MIPILSEAAVTMRVCVSLAAPVDIPARETSCSPASSFMSRGPVIASRVGGSFTAFTVMLAVFVAELKGVEPPLSLVSTFVCPLVVPPLLSHARKVMPSVTVPFQ